MKHASCRLCPVHADNSESPCLTFRVKGQARLCHDGSPSSPRYGASVMHMQSCSTASPDSSTLSLNYQVENYQGSLDSRKRLKAQLVPKPITMQGQKYDCDRMCAHCGWLTSNVITEGGCSMCLWYDLCDDCKRQCKGTDELLCPQCPEDYTPKEKDFQCPRDYRSARELLILKNAVYDVHDLFESTGMWHPSNVKRYGRPAEHPLGSYMHVA